jgi:hypothetical protein
VVSSWRSLGSLARAWGGRDTHSLKERSSAGRQRCPPHCSTSPFASIPHGPRPPHARARGLRSLLLVATMDDALTAEEWGIVLDVSAYAAGSPDLSYEDPLTRYAALPPESQERMEAVMVAEILDLFRRSTGDRGS